MEKIKRKITIVFIFTILILTNIVSAVTTYGNVNFDEVEVGDEIEFTIDFDENVITTDFSVHFDSNKLTYVDSLTQNLKTNYIKDKSEIICCYYDLNKIGTNKILLKFKAIKETGKTNITATNITIHTNWDEKQIDDITSKNIRIVKSSTNQEDNIIENNTNNNLQLDIANNTINNDVTQNNGKDNTISTNTLPKTGIKFSIRDLLIILVAYVLIMIIIKNNKLTKNTKVIISVIIILVSAIIYFSKYVSATNEDKIFINKNEKSILVVLSTSNEKRNMSIKEFKERTKAVSINSNMLISEVEAIFNNNEKYIVKVFRDENKDGYVNSSDIYELLNKDTIENIDELSNFIIKKQEFKNYNIIPEGYEEFKEDSIIEKDEYISVKNVEQLKLLNAKAGDKYKTLGYYEENDTGAGKYDIVEKNTNIKVDNGLYIELNNGLIAKLVVENNTVNVKQFGAKGDSTNDDTKYLKTAFNSGIANVELPKGEYKITDKISLDTESTNIIGNNSTIFTDNDFKPEKYSEFLFIMQSNDCSISNLNIEAKETKNIENLYKAQVYVGATNINIIKCSFKIPETASNEHSYSNIDLYTGWHNVLIKDCDLYLANDAKEGGCIWIRDLFNRGASDATFINNKCYKKCHDEILAVFMGSIENVNILNNTFIMPNSTDPSTMCFTLGSGSSKKAKNIKFEGNTIDTKATMSLLVSRNAENLSIKNNKIKFERVTSLTNTFLMYFPEENLKEVTIEDNNFEVNNTTGTAINGLFSSNTKDVIFNNNTVIVNSDISEVFNGGIINTNNNITFNGAVKILVNKPREFKSNHIIFNKGFGSIAQYYVGNLNWESNIVNNVFENNYDELSANEKSILLMFNGGTLNNYIVNFEGNVVKSDKANYRRNLIYLLNITDKESQTIKIVNNKINGYKEGWKDKNQEQHKILVE